MRVEQRFAACCMNQIIKVKYVNWFNLVCVSLINPRSNGCLFPKSNFLDCYLLSAHVFPLVFLSVFPIDADSGEDQNNRQKSVRRGWYQAVSRGWGQDRLLQSTGELTAAAITTDSHTDRTYTAQLLSHSAFHFGSTAILISTPVPRYRAPPCHSEQSYKDIGWNLPLWNRATLICHSRLSVFK